MQGKWEETTDDFDREIYTYNGGYIKSFLFSQYRNFIIIEFTAPEYSLPSFTGISTYPLAIMYPTSQQENFEEIVEEVDKIAPFHPVLKEKILAKILLASENPSKRADGLLKSPRSLEFKEAIKLIKQFLNNKKDLLKPFTHFNVATELLAIIVSPEEIDQKSYQLCGPDIFIRELAIHSPNQFVYLGIKLAEEGKSSIPFAIQMPENLDDTSIILSMMIAIRHSSNSSLIGYRPKEKFKFFTEVTGVDWDIFCAMTTPKDLELWFKSSGFRVLADDTKVLISNGQEISWLLRFAAGGIYSNKHESIATEGRIKRLQKYNADASIGINLFISVPLRDLMQKSIEVDQICETRSSMPLGVQIGHFVKLTQFFENVDGSLNLELNTYGKLFWINNLPKEIFDRHCFGAFITQYKHQSLALDEVDCSSNQHTFLRG